MSCTALGVGASKYKARILLWLSGIGPAPNRYELEGQVKMVTLSDKAAAEIKQIMQQQGGTFEGIRVFVAGGGCSGMSYGMQIADEPATADDLVFEADGVKVIVDVASHQYLTGASIDFDDSLQGGGFKINN